MQLVASRSLLRCTSLSAELGQCEMGDPPRALVRRIIEALGLILLKIREAQ